MTGIERFIDCDGRLTALPSKRKPRVRALLYLAGKFDPAARYTEQEVNALLCQWHTFRDPATLRRELYDYGFLGREPSGRAYWLEPDQPTLEALDARFS